MNEASKRFLWRAIKWVAIPVTLFFAGYFVLWPVIGDWLNLRSSGDEPVVFETTT